MARAQYNDKANLTSTLTDEQPAQGHTRGDACQEAADFSP